MPPMARVSSTWLAGRWRQASAGALGLALVLLAVPGTEAHKGITSKYNYNEHIFPILRDRCGRCHVEGGPAPMSLLTYNSAIPWAESMREQLIGQKMPPWYADPTGPAVKGGHAITTKELDMLLTWAVGGTPQSTESSFMGTKAPNGDAPPAPVVSLLSQWNAGPPDLKIAMDTAYTVPAGTIDDACEMVVSTGLTEPAWVNAVDFMPGAPSMVRDALISVDGGPILAAWVPGHEATRAPSGAAFRLPAGAKLRLKIHYKKNWQDEQKEIADRSTVGLYFTEEPLSGRAVEALDVAAPAAAAVSLAPRTFGGSFTTGGRVVGLRPSFDQAYASAEIVAVAPSGRRVTLLKLRSPQPQWLRRYWLQEPIELPQGTKIEVTAIPAPPDDFAIPIPKRYALQVGIDYVAQ